MVNAKEFFSGNFLKAEDCKGGEICKILDEGEIVELTNPEGKVKTVMNFQIKVIEGSEKLAKEAEKTFTPNKTNGNILVEAFGEETRNWIGKEFKIVMGKTTVFGKVKDTIIIEPLGVVPTEKVN